MKKCHISKLKKKIEHAQLDAKFAIPESTLTVPNYSVGNFKFCETSNLGFLKVFFVKKHKKRHISKTAKN